jgi:acetyl-CoA C-acetyltransferase
VFPHSSTVCNHATFVPTRWQLDDLPGARVSGQRALELAGVGVDDVELVDLYSCFPAAVQLYARAVGLSLGRPLTVTGGMTFAGGPLNNYVLQAVVRLVELLRERPDAWAVSSSVSGSLVKQGWGIWSGRPPAAGFRQDDCTAALAAVDDPAPLDADLTGPARVVSSTVVHERGEPARAVAIVEAADGRRSIAASTEPDEVAAFLGDASIGRTVEIRPAGELRTVD